ncbi:MAG: MoxR family ATPase [Chloroflexia bacterium]|nr:MoxR family ATPase [Chloroflexia bacterium]MDQ3780585.1 MoxR family ATPase [Chloroflexota bacterium]
MDPSSVQTVARVACDNVERVVVGKRHEVLLVLVALLCRGHVLIEDVPGVGKTVLAKAVARSIGCTFKRIQFTPDLLPSDVTGVNVFNQQSARFEFRPGPVVAQMVLADEINRATPKTQAALLEAMEEAQITVDGVTHPLPTPFVVLATENPIEYEGTFPLPEAQLDRFLIRLSLGYPGRAGELEMLDRQHRTHPLETISQVIPVEDLVLAQAAVKNVRVAMAVKEYIVSLVEATRYHDDVYLGASPRGSLALYNASRAWAALEGRDFVKPDDVKILAEPTLAHRIIVNPNARMRNVDSRTVVADILGRVEVPGAQPSVRGGWSDRGGG